MSREWKNFLIRFFMLMTLGILLIFIKKYTFDFLENAEIEKEFLYKIKGVVVFLFLIIVALFFHFFVARSYKELEDKRKEYSEDKGGKFF